MPSFDTVPRAGGETSAPRIRDALSDLGRRGYVMMISQTAVLCLTATWQRLSGRRLTSEESADARVLPALAEEALMAFGATTPESPLTASAASARQLVPAPDPPVVTVIDPSAPLSASETRARAAALRALTLSRGRRFAAAQLAFAEAARLDPMLDLTRTPAFWKLERAAHEAAIDAYVEVGRDRDAAVLRARVQSTFRPKPIRTRQQPILSP